MFWASVEYPGSWIFYGGPKRFVLLMFFGNFHEDDVNELVPIPFVMTAPPKRLCFPYVLGLRRMSRILDRISRILDILRRPKKLCFPYVLGNSHEGDVNELVPTPFVMTAPPKRLCFPCVFGILGILRNSKKS